MEKEDWRGAVGGIFLPRIDFEAGSRPLTRLQALLGPIPESLWRAKVSASPFDLYLERLQFQSGIYIYIYISFREISGKWWRRVGPRFSIGERFRPVLLNHPATTCGISTDPFPPSMRKREFAEVSLSDALNFSRNLGKEGLVEFFEKSW